jgi:hypothetical protein
LYIIDCNQNYIPFPPFVHIEAARTTLLKGVSSKVNLRSQYSYHIVTGKLNCVVLSGTVMVLRCDERVKQIWSFWPALNYCSIAGNWDYLTITATYGRLGQGFNWLKSFISPNIPSTASRSAVTLWQTLASSQVVYTDSGCPSYPEST